MEPTAQKPNAPAAAAKPATAVPGPNTARAPGPAAPETRSRRPIVMMSLAGVLVGTMAVVMLHFAPAAPSAGKRPAAAKAGAVQPAAATSGGTDGEANGGAAVKTAAAIATPATRPAPADVRPAAPTTGAAVTTVMKEPAVPKWTGGVQNAWSRHPSAAYELVADNQVALLAKRVRPVLTVRCEAGRTEVFVLTESAAVIEGDDGKHTVRVGFDGSPDLTQRWLASADYDALFAPDGVRLAQQIAASRSMRFGFAPYGAAPVVAQFDVSGFDTLVGTVAKTCKWR